MIEAYKKFWTNYANFKDRSTRGDFWWVVLCHCIVTFIINNLVRIIAGDTANMIVALIIALASLVPCLALAIRRLHDINKSGWYLFMGLIPLAGPIILIVYYCMASVNEGNQYGEVAK